MVLYYCSPKLCDFFSTHYWVTVVLILIDLCNRGKCFPLQMDTFVNPLRNSMRNVSNAVKSLPDSLTEGMTKMSDNMGKISERLGQDIKQSFFKVRMHRSNKQQTVPFGATSF